MMLTRLGAVLATMAAVVFGGTAAHADVGTTDIQRFQNVNTGTCLTDPVTDGYCFSDIAQWDVISDGGGYVQLRNVASGLCLDYYDAHGLRTMPCTGQTPQSHYVWHNDDGSLTFEFIEANTPTCLDVSPLGTRGVPCNGSTHQKWV